MKTVCKYVRHVCVWCHVEKCTTVCVQCCQSVQSLFFFFFFLMEFLCYGISQQPTVTPDRLAFEPQHPRWIMCHSNANSSSFPLLRVHVWMGGGVTVSRQRENIFFFFATPTPIQNSTKPSPHKNPSQAQLKIALPSQRVQLSSS